MINLAWSVLIFGGLVVAAVSVAVLLRGGGPR